MREYMQFLSILVSKAGAGEGRSLCHRAQPLRRTRLFGMRALAGRHEEAHTATHDKLAELIAGQNEIKAAVQKNTPIRTPAAAQGAGRVVLAVCGRVLQFAAEY